MATNDVEFVIRASTDLLRGDLARGMQQFSRFAGDAEQRLNRIDNRFASIGRTLRSTFAAFGVSLGVAGIVRFAQSAVSAADAIGEAARAAGIGAERFQRLRAVFELNGVSSEMFEASIIRANKALGDFISKGGGPAKAAIERLGLATRIANGEIRTAEQFFDAFVAALENVKGEAEAASLAAAVFGREAGPRMLQAMRMGVEGMKEAEAAVEGVFSDESIARANEIDDKMREISRTVGVGLKGAFVDALYAVSDFFGAFDTDLENINEKLVELQGRLRVAEVSQGASAIVPAIRQQIQELQRERSGGQAAGQAMANFLAGSVAAGGRTAGGGVGLDEITVDGRLRAQDYGQIGGGVQPIVLDQQMFDEEMRLEEQRADKRRAVQKEMEGLQVDALRAQDRMSEAIRLSADRQIMEWERVAEETPEFADEAAKAIVAINERAAAEIEDLGDATREKLAEFATTFAATFESRGIEALMSGDLSSAVRGFTKDIVELIFRLTVLRPLAESLGGLFVGAGPGRFFAGLFGGGRAMGGPVAAGTGYIVGEQGPEYFKPNVSGRILSAGQTRAGAGVVINQHNTFNTQGGGDSASFARALDANNKRLKAEIRREQQLGRF